MACILVIDDRSDIRLSLNLLLHDHGYDVVEADTPQVAQVKLKELNIDLVLLDMNFTLDTTSGEEGLAFLKWLKTSPIEVPVIAMTAWSNTDIVVRSMKLGAKDFVEKPWRNKQLLHTITQQLNLTDLQHQNNKLKQQLTADISTAYQWQSAVMKQLYKKVDTVADTDVNILLTGKNGTGKSELAHYIHSKSQRAKQPFVSVNMGAITENLFESEMFGHKKGAFTDAKQNRIGRFELAENGSLFLDEIANIPLSQQAKMLRVLENGEYELVGSSQTKKTNTRIISATNGSFEQLIAGDLFREDLYYRLNTIEFNVPCLKERTEDIIPLACYFIAKFTKKYNLVNKQLAEDAQQAILAYHWPGNVREMSHIIERAVLLTESEQISESDLHIKVMVSQNTVEKEIPLVTLEQAEISLVKRALKETNNHVPKAAVLLGLSKASMYRRLEKYGLSKK